jgi:hypothetical protein
MSEHVEFETIGRPPTSLHMKRARDDDVEIVRIVRPRQTAECGLLDWLPPEMRAHVRSFLGLRDRFRLHRVCRLLHDEDEQPLSHPMLAFLAATTNRKERRRFWQCVAVLDKVGVTAWPEFAHLHIDHGYWDRECIHGPKVFYWRLPCYIAFAEAMTKSFEALRIVVRDRTSSIADLLRPPEPDFDHVTTYPYRYWSGGTSSDTARPDDLVRHREWLRKTIAAESARLALV